MPKEGQDSLLVALLLGLKDTMLTNMLSGVVLTMVKTLPFVRQQMLMELYTRLK